MRQGGLFYKLETLEEDSLILSTLLNHGKPMNIAEIKEKVNHKIKSQKLRMYLGFYEREGIIERINNYPVILRINQHYKEILTKYLQILKEVLDKNCDKTVVKELIKKAERRDRK